MSNKSNPFTRWKLDLSAGRGGPSQSAEWPSPPGYSRSGGDVVSASGSSPSSGDQSHLITKRAWDIAIAPVKSIPMNLFMMYMAGSSISIFPIMMVGMMAMRPLKAMMSVRATFAAVESEAAGSLILQKALFVLGNCLGIAVAVYKCHSMGLLPTHSSDWLDFQAPPERMEYSAAGFAFV